jgi:phosphomannomutase
MHGVGYKFSLEAFKSFNLHPFIPVNEQVQPDPEFPTVKFPNPEGNLFEKNKGLFSSKKNFKN